MGADNDDSGRRPTWPGPSLTQTLWDSVIIYLLLAVGTLTLIFVYICPPHPPKPQIWSNKGGESIDHHSLPLATADMGSATRLRVWRLTGRQQT